MDNRIKICEKIAEDMKNDAAAFDGKLFTGKTVGEYYGYHGAAIAALALLMKSILEEKELIKNEWLLKKKTAAHNGRSPVTREKEIFHPKEIRKKD